MTTSIDDVKAEIRQREADEKAALDAQIKKAEAGFKPFYEERERERKAAEEEAKAEKQQKAALAEKKLEDEARRIFFAANPGAGENLYLTFQGEMRREVMLRRMKEQEQDEAEVRRRMFEQYRRSI